MNSYEAMILPWAFVSLEPNLFSGFQEPAPPGQKKGINPGHVEHAFHPNPFVRPVDVFGNGSVAGGLTLSEQAEGPQVGRARGNVLIRVPARKAHVAVIEGLKGRKIPGYRMPVRPESIEFDLRPILEKPGVVSGCLFQGLDDFVLDIPKRNSRKIGQPGMEFGRGRHGGRPISAFEDPDVEVQGVLNLSVGFRNGSPVQLFFESP